MHRPLLTTPAVNPSRTVDLAGAKAALACHPLYAAVDSLARLRSFTEHHVACVHDFMWLLKSLQRDLAPASVPWLPPTDPKAARLINAIVLDEESDVLPYREGHASHFAWYVEAMEELGAETAPVRAWVEAMRAGGEPIAAMRNAGMPEAACEFVATTVSFLSEPLAIRAAVFSHGREDVIPRMFLPLVERLTARALPCGRLLSYLQRHIELDGGEHGRAAEALLERLCGEDVTLRTRAEDAALRALAARRRLWDAITLAI